LNENREGYKKTKLGWIPTEWEVRKIKSILNKSKGSIKVGPFGSQLKKNELVENGIKVYGQENIIKNDFSIGTRYISEEKFSSLSTYEITPDDILITMMGTGGNCRVVPKNIQRGIMDSHLIRLRINKQVINSYLSYLIREYNIVKNEIIRYGQGGIMSGLSASIIKELSFPLPSTLEQESILEILSTWDLAIEKTEELIKKKTKLKKGLMQQLLKKEDMVLMLLQ